MLCGRATRRRGAPRQVAMYVMRQLTFLAGRNRPRVLRATTVLYACEKISTLLRTDNLLEEKVNALISTLASG
jgi:chromosomal replication initiation ATPase DnaA